MGTDPSYTITLNQQSHWSTTSWNCISCTSLVKFLLNACSVAYEGSEPEWSKYYALCITGIPYNLEMLGTYPVAGLRYRNILIYKWQLFNQKPVIQLEAEASNCITAIVYILTMLPCSIPSLYYTRLQCQLTHCL